MVSRMIMKTMTITAGEDNNYLTPFPILPSILYVGDLWNLKYLHKFKWSHLTEKVAYERRVREQKLRVEMMQARRENAAYAEMVETGKKLDKIEERKRKRDGTTNNHDDDNHEINKNKKTKKGRKQKRITPIQDGSDKPAKLAVLGGLV